MIKITVVQTTTQQFKATENFVTSEKPTDKIKHSSYGDEVVMERTFETHEVTKTKTDSSTIFEQILEDNEFDLKAVIAAINSVTIVSRG